MKQIWLATGNEHKKEEFQTMLKNSATVKTLKDLPKPVEIQEDGKTFEENALIKARALYSAVREPVIADDSGLEVDAMHGAPGVYSARFMGEDTPYEIKNQAILDAVKGKERSARFICAIAYIEKDGTEHVYKGVMEGYIHDRMEGENGFGYDPIFYYPPFQTTSAAVDPEVKNKESHRGKALAMFLKDWKS